MYTLTTKFGPFLWPKTALNDVFHSHSAFSDFPETPSVDFSVDLSDDP